MMEATGHGRLDDLAFVKALHPSWPAIIDQAGRKSTLTRWTE
jgi:hypothetical protein